MLANPQARVFPGLKVIFGLCGELDGLVNERENLLRGGLALRLRR
jgi:hypothetical protein